MARRTFYMNCMECFKKRVIFVIDTKTMQNATVDTVKGKCSNCKVVWTLAQLWT